MAKCGVYGDVHLTKNMRTLQSSWETAATSSILNMYKKFDEEKVDLVVCLGDFFDKPIIEAKSLHLVLPILHHMNTRAYPTYLLLGNHEIDDDDHNILDYLSEYDNIIPITNYDIIREDFLFIPYNVDPTELDPDLFKGRYVFTHHDIYGSSLAGDKTRAFFGIDPKIFKEAKMVMNGHVHLNSVVNKNVMNAGSLLISQHGELRLWDYPCYYIVDSAYDNIHMDTYYNEYSLFYLSSSLKDVEDIMKRYPSDQTILRIDYEEEDIPDFESDNLLRVTWRKLITSIEGDRSPEAVQSYNFDFKSYLTEYIKNDPSVPDKDKEDYIKIGLEVLG